MSEADYQRGLRGGECNVSISDNERWQDWKAGRDERERRLDAEDEERIRQVLSPAEQNARIDARIRKREEDDARELVFAKAQARENIQHRVRHRRQDQFGVLLTVTLGVGAGCIAGFIVGGILLLFGLPFVLGFGATLILVSYSVIRHDARISADSEKRRIEEDQRDEAILRRPEKPARDGSR